MDVDLNKAIRQAIKTGRVELGLDTTTKAAMTGRARLIIVSDRVPPGKLGDLRHYTSLSETPIILYDGSSADLGRTCRKPFQISSVAIIDPGDSNILAAAKGA
jgi:large subunit ribosomal protein L30e